MWNSLQAANRQYSEPTLFISIYKVEPFLRWSKTPREAVAEIARVPVKIRTSVDYIELALADGSRRRITIPELAEEFTVVGLDINGATGKSINVPLHGIEPQDLTITMPDFFVNGIQLKAGPIDFKYNKQTVYLVC
jgi:hypothetical protein